jgi:hypothetical protein
MAEVNEESLVAGRDTEHSGEKPILETGFLTVGSGDRTDRAGAPNNLHEAPP